MSFRFNETAASKFVTRLFRRDRLVFLHSLLAMGVVLQTLSPGAGDSPPRTLPVEWNRGLNCSSPGEAVQVFSLSATTFLLRQNLCSTEEAPFLHLLLGTERALLIDTGNLRDASVREAVDRVLLTASRLTARLIVAHSHGHGDHLLGDDAFKDRSDTVVVSAGLQSITTFFHFKDGVADLDLGGSTVHLLHIPGHTNDHIAVYDAQENIALTGDSVYPGRIYIGEDNWHTFRNSMHRLHSYLQEKPKDLLLLGGHIEMSREPGIDYPFAVIPRDKEHVLELGLSALTEMLKLLDSTNEPTCLKNADLLVFPKDARIPCASIPGFTNMHGNITSAAVMSSTAGMRKQ